MVGQEQGSGARALQRLAPDLISAGAPGAGVSAGLATKLSIRSIGKSYGPVLALADASLDLAEGEFLTLLGPSGSGKTHAADDRRRADPADGRRGLDRRQAVDLRAAEQARHRHGVPELRALPAPDRPGEHRLPAQDAPHAGGAGGRGGAPRPRDRAAAARRRPAAAGALRRPAAAHRARALHGLPAVDHPDGRAARRARQEAARPDAARDQAAAQAPRHHRPLCHPRPGGGDDDVRPHLPHEGTGGSSRSARRRSSISGRARAFAADFLGEFEHHRRARRRVRRRWRGRGCRAGCASGRRSTRRSRPGGPSRR